MPIFRTKLLPLLLGYRTILMKVIISSQVENILKHLITNSVCSSTRKFIPNSMASHSRKKGQSVAIVSKTSNLAIHWFFLIMGCTTVWWAWFYLSSSSSSSSPYICHAVGPLVDPFRSHLSRSLSKGLPVEKECFITLGNLLWGILFTCCIHFLLYSSNLSRIDVIFNSFVICAFVL